MHRDRFPVEILQVKFESLTPKAQLSSIYLISNAFIYLLQLAVLNLVRIYFGAFIIFDYCWDLHGTLLLLLRLKTVLLVYMRRNVECLLRSFLASRILNKVYTSTAIGFEWVSATITQIFARFMHCLRSSQATWLLLSYLPATNSRLLCRRLAINLAHFQRCTCLHLRKKQTCEST